LFQSKKSVNNKNIQMFMKKLIARIFSTVLTVAFLAMVVFFSAPTAKAATGATVSVTFDDGFLSTYTNALPILASRNVPATVYVTSGFIDSGVTDDFNLPAMTWSQVQNLQNSYGWEIGGHTQTHPELPTLTTANVISQISTSNTAFSEHGLNVTNFASPFGAYDNAVLVQLLKSYYSHRGFADIAYNDPTFANRGVLQVQQVNSNTTLAQVKSYIDQAKANNTWLILVFHHVSPTTHEYEYTTTEADLIAIADYINSTGIKVQTVEQALAKPGVNVLSNYDFANGLQDWTTTNTQVVADTANNGAYGDSENAVKITGGAAATHLFSSLVDAVPGASYTLEAFYNTIGLTAGELGFYMDEYDSNGNWISGKWLGLVANNAVGYFNKLYTTTSTLVSKLRVQTYLTAGSTGTAYVDNVDLHNLSATATPSAVPTGSITGTPTGTPSTTPTPVQGNNLVQNGSFENATSGWATNWTRNSTAAYVLDTDSHGDNGANAVHVVTSGTTAHMFSDLINVTQTTYTWKTYLTATTLTGEFGFYIDEYDTNGTWISGQWKGLVSAPETGTKQFSYIPSSANVAKIGLQYYLIGGGTANMYLDSVALTGAVTATPTATGTPSVTPTGTTPSVTPTGVPSVTPTGSVTPTPSPLPTGTGTNIIVNPSFETVSGSFPSNWTTNLGSAYTLNTATQGNNGTNSVHVGSSATTGHLFSEQVAVDQAAYTWNSYVKALSMTGEFGFYIDEYDVNGAWISGQWKGMISAPFSGVKQFAYTPSSATVAKASLQYYLIGGATADLFLDSVSLSK
jgi:peptidoglycan/xylan/chitin deacetylase (PgdA/CDA1 family)